MFQQMLDLFAKALVAFGGITAVVGVIGFSRGLREHAGPEMNSGIMSIVSGGVIVLASVLLKTITL